MVDFVPSNHRSSPLICFQVALVAGEVTVSQDTATGLAIPSLKSDTDIRASALAAGGKGLPDRVRRPYFVFEYSSFPLFPLLSPRQPYSSPIQFPQVA